MAWNPARVQFPLANLQHMFNRHKADWGFANVNWNNNTRVLFQQRIQLFVTNTPIVHAGTYRGADAWLVIDQNAPNLCAIIHRPSYDIWSGWQLSALQFQFANNPPYSLGGGALSIFGNILDQILAANDHGSLDTLAQKFIDTYKASSVTERHDQATEEALMNFFAAADNYAPPEVASQISGASQISDLDEMKKLAQQTLATLERQTVG